MRERIIRAVAGSIILLSVTLALAQHIYWLGLAGFVGLNLFQSAFSGFCPLEKILQKFGIGERDQHRGSQRLTD